VRLQGKSDRRGPILALVVLLAIVIAIAVYVLYLAPAT
jgi:hypothetical protein